MARGLVTTLMVGGLIALAGAVVAVSMVRKVRHAPVPAVEAA